MRRSGAGSQTALWHLPVSRGRAIARTWVTPLRITERAGALTLMLHLMGVKPGTYDITVSQVIRRQHHVGKILRLTIWADDGGTPSFDFARTRGVRYRGRGACSRYLGLPD
jgi:hypothetical protein